MSSPDMRHPSNRRDVIHDNMRAHEVAGVKSAAGKAYQQTLPGLEAVLASRVSGKTREAFDEAHATILGNLHVATKLAGAHAAEVLERYKRFKSAADKVAKCDDADAKPKLLDKFEAERLKLEAAIKVSRAVKATGDVYAKVAKVMDEVAVSSAPGHVKISGAATLTAQNTGQPAQIH